MKKFGWIAIILCFLGIAGVAFADATITVPKGQKFSGNLLQYTQIFRNDGLVTGDLILMAQSLSQAGEVQGDIITATQTFNQTGQVFGDVIGVGQDLVIDGKIAGDVRVLSAQAILGGEIAKNVNAFCGMVNQKQEGVIGGNFHACGSEVISYGKVKGFTHIVAGRIILGGEYFGDVAINSEFTGEEAWDEEKTRLTVLPGTVIHGKLHYRGSVADIQKGARIGKFEWDKPTVKPAEKVKRFIDKALWGFIRFILTTLAFFLLGTILFKAFPKALREMGDYTRKKPFSALGMGLMVCISIVVAVVIAVILFALSALITPAFGFVFSLLMLGLYITVFFLALIPVADGLGERLFGNRVERKFRLAWGLATINFIVYILGLFTETPPVGSFFGFMVFAVHLTVLCIGSGAVAYSIMGRLRKGRTKEGVPAANL